MNKKKNILFSVLLIIFVIGGVFVSRKTGSNEFYDNSEPKQIKNEQTLSMMIEQTAGAGDYKMETRSSWPTEGYIFNATLSKCENGGELGWDDTNKVVTMAGNMSDKCYVYFDVEPKIISDVCSSGDKLAGCLTDLGNKGKASNTKIYHHDGTLENGINDGSYRYAGASAEVNNYVCFGSDEDTCSTDNLYRIIGVFSKKENNETINQVKLIKEDYATTDELGTYGDYYQTYKEWGMDDTYKGSYGDGTRIGVYYWNYTATGSATNTWSTSLLNKTNLNTNFITYLKNLDTVNNKWEKMIAETTWKVGGNTWANIGTVEPATAYKNEITSPDATTYGPSENSKIGLMYVTDYEFATSPSSWTLYGYNSDSTKDYRAATSINWMYMGLNEWTIFRNSGGSYYAFAVASSGYVSYLNVGNVFSVRPVFYLVSTATYSSGTGESSNPIRLG